MSVSDILKYILSVFLIIAGVSGFYYYSELSLLLRVVSLLVVLVMVLALIYTTELGGRIWLFVLDSKQEVRRVVWPTREETTRTTMLVFAMVFTVGMVLWVLDMFLFWGVRVLTGQGVG